MRTLINLSFGGTCILLFIGCTDDLLVFGSTSSSSSSGATDGGDVGGMGGAGGASSGISTSSSSSSSSSSSGSGGAPMCTAHEQCMGTINECRYPNCVNGQCIVIVTSEGTVTMNNKPGDCVVRQCDGLGKEETVLDPDDWIADDNECTLDYCAGGLPTFHEPIQLGNPCKLPSGANGVCPGTGSTGPTTDQGKCAECWQGYIECPPDKKCWYDGSVKTSKCIPK